MKTKTVMMVGLLVFFLVLGLRSLWNIDVAMGSALTGGQLISITGFQDFNVFYHSALIMNLVSFIGLIFISLLFFAENLELKGGSR